MQRITITDADGHVSYRTFADHTQGDAYAAWIDARDDRTYTTTSTCGCGADATDTITIGGVPVIFCGTCMITYRQGQARAARQARAVGAASAARAIAYHSRMSATG